MKKQYLLAAALAILGAGVFVFKGKLNTAVPVSDQEQQSDYDRIFMAMYGGVSAGDLESLLQSLNFDASGQDGTDLAIQAVLMGALDYVPVFSNFGLNFNLHGSGGATLMEILESNSQDPNVQQLMNALN